jgi:hypothetical protein
VCKCASVQVRKWRATDLFDGALGRHLQREGLTRRRLDVHFHGNNKFSQHHQQRVRLGTFGFETERQEKALTQT